jgi:hypothetical protein
VSFWETQRFPQHPSGLLLAPDRRISAPDAILPPFETPTLTVGARRFFLASGARIEYQQLASSVHQAIREENEELANQALREVFLYWVVEPPTFGLRYIVREQALQKNAWRRPLSYGQPLHSRHL